jgi:hypothetical protein
VTTLEEIRAAVAELREVRRKPTRGQALYELNLWLGAQRKALQEEYERKLLQIEDQPEPTLEDRVNPEVLSLVGRAVAEKVSRSNIRRALGLTTLDETDEVIRLATGHLHEAVEKGAAVGFTLTPTGETHAKGWPMYAVTLLATGETHSSVYLITTPRTTQVERRHLRISPSPAGSEEILDAVWSSGAAEAIWARGKLAP